MQNRQLDILKSHVIFQTEQHNKKLQSQKEIAALNAEEFQRALGHSEQEINKLNTLIEEIL